MRYRLFSLAALALGMASVVHAESPVSPDRASQGLTREQVLADLQQWHAAGMSFVAHPSGYSESAQSPEYQRYLQMHQQQSGDTAVAQDHTATQPMEQSIVKTN
ncbi:MULTISPECIES: DUF4148 domain-containing protein [Comamonas]|uniref:DUF4148 domain-containing protein n=1 Tax=Comamonas avium TaxID=2762231 RepID=A0ABR8SCC2_9BURK|nr:MULTISPECIES: DUF4148 domain-containing protein [Comamonas]MBD7961095.1 DUF4148 domain-containing protein [Comamonas avium]MBD9400928.1 DUF4148 domain-containing protein [Comamonas sp. CMM02]